MVQHYILKNSLVKNWLGDIEPAWTLLHQDSFSALLGPPAPDKGPIRLRTDLTPQEIDQSAIARNALILLHAASRDKGLKLTATGNLSRKVVSEMFEAFTWPDLDKADLTRYYKVLNEPDFLPLFLIRRLVQEAQLVEQQKDFLQLTPTGSDVLNSPASGVLQALLFHIAFWMIDLGFLGRYLLDEWPQREVGIILWSLSVSANQWQSPGRLTRLCTVPTEKAIEPSGGEAAFEMDEASFAMEAKILRPLYFFGLLERRIEAIPGENILKSHFYRKSPLFDRFIAFDVKLEPKAARSH